MPAAVLYSGHSASWLTYVGLEEQEKAAGYRNREDAVSYAAQHTLMRCIAASALDVRATLAADIPVDRRCTLCETGELHGKPRIEGISFNMARSQGAVAGAFSPDPSTRLGLDIEKMRGSYYAGFDNISLSPTEKDHLAAYSLSTQRVLRLMLWTGKQAVLKATGHGLSLSPSAVLLNLRGFPADVVDPIIFETQALLTLPGGKPENFYVSWQVYEDFAIAVASDSPVSVELLAVLTPLEVKRAVQSLLTFKKIT